MKKPHIGSKLYSTKIRRKDQQRTLEQTVKNSSAQIDLTIVFSGQVIIAFREEDNSCKTSTIGKLVNMFSPQKMVGSNT